MLDASHVKTGVNASTWEEAIKAAGAILVEARSCVVSYVDAMITSVEELGPYIVITPHVALAHARPSVHVNQVDMSLVVLAEPVEFAAGANDPVKLVFAFCAIDNKSHLEQLCKLAEKLNPETIERLSSSASVDEVLEILCKA